MARSKLRKFEEELHTMGAMGIRYFPGQRSWNFVNCILYCWTVITTIGNEVFVVLRFEGGLEEYQNTKKKNLKKIEITLGAISIFFLFNIFPTNAKSYICPSWAPFKY